MANQSSLNAQQLPPHVTHDDPLLSSLVQVVKFHGIDASAQQLTVGLPLKNDVLSLDLVQRAVGRVRCQSTIVRRKLKDIPQAVLPVILVLTNGRTCVLYEYDAHEALVSYPEGSTPVSIPFQELVDQYDGLMIVVQPHFYVESRASEGIKDSEQKNWFWVSVFANWRLYRDALGAALLINVFAIMMPLFTLNVYDRVVPNEAFETLWVMASGLILALFFNWILTVVRARVVDKASSEVDIDVSARIMERVLDIRLDNRPSSVGAFAANLRSFEAVRDFIASASLTTFVDLPFLFLFLAVLGWLSPYLMLPPAIAAVLVLVVSVFSQWRIRKLSGDLFKAGAQRNAVLVESLAGLETVKVLNAQGRTQQRWEESTRDIAAINLKIRAVTSATVSFIQFVQQIVTVSVVIIGVYLVSAAELSLGGIIASSMLAGRSLSSLGPLAGLMMQYYNARQSLSAIDRYMQLPAEHELGTSFLPRPLLQGEVEFNNVSFTYPDAGRPTLDGVSFKVQAGERVGIIGRIGSGKTTIARLILGLYQPTEGTVLIDKVDHRQIDPIDVRRSMGYVSQDPVLFYGTLKQNLMMGAPFATDEQMLEAAKIAGVDYFAAQHPEGYDMVISERGESLSGGQRQSIAVARALLNNPSVLILDEPSSNMDNQSELALRQQLKPICEQRTVFLITHRMPLLELVDRLIVIDEGRIVADGPKEQVIAALRERRIGQRRS